MAQNYSGSSGGSYVTDAELSEILRLLREIHTVITGWNDDPPVFA